MPRPSEYEIEESYDREGLVLDDQDEDLLRHVLLDDEPEPGLHKFTRGKGMHTDEES